MTGAPLVTVLVPMVDEAADIEACLTAVLDQDHPRDRLEVLVVDGGSTDDSVERSKQLLAGAGLRRWRVLHNPARTTPSSLNLGLGEATGELLCRVDARTLVQPDHVRRCADVLLHQPEVMVVGGAQVARARGTDARARGIARALNNHLSMGGADYRSGGRSGPTDTVYLGAFRTADLRGAGGWDVRLATNQDFELNRRLGRDGVVWLDADLQSGYLPREDLRDIWKQYHRFGRWKVRYWRTTGDRPVRRQYVLLVAPAIPLVVLALLAVRRPSALAPFAGVGAAGLLVVDQVGAGGGASVPERAWAMVATATISVAWWLGVLREALVPA